MIDHEKIVVNLPMTKQVGFESWRDGFITKIFPFTTTFSEIMNWAKSIDKTISISDLYFGIYND